MSGWFSRIRVHAREEFLLHSGLTCITQLDRRVIDGSLLLHLVGDEDVAFLEPCNSLK